MKPTQITLKRLLALVIIACVSSFASAGDRQDRMISKLDQNGDGLISRDEFQSPKGDPGARILERADLNDDGSVTIEEAQNAHAVHKAERKAEMTKREAEHDARFEQMMSKVDNDGDGIISPDEMRGMAFNRMDKNDDGFISADEFKSAHDRRRHAKGKQGMRER
jgi:hypothetical protein